MPRGCWQTMLLCLLVAGCAGPRPPEGPAADADALAVEAQKAFHQGRVQQGIDLLRSSLVYNRGTDRVSAAAQNLNDLGVLSVAAGDRAAAERYLREALVLYERLDDVTGRLSARLNLASLKNVPGAGEDVWQELQAIRGEAQAKRKKDTAAGARDQMGQWLVRQKRWAEAREAFQEAVRCYHEIRSPILEAAALHNAAEVELHLGHFAQARGHLDKAIAIDKERQLWPALGDDLLLMGKAQEGLKQGKAAIGFFERAFYVLQYTGNTQKMDAAREGIQRAGGRDPQ